LIRYSKDTVLNALLRPRHGHFFLP